MPNIPETSTVVMFIGMYSSIYCPNKFINKSKIKPAKQDIKSLKTPFSGPNNKPLNKYRIISKTINTKTSLKSIFKFNIVFRPNLF